MEAKGILVQQIDLIPKDAIALLEKALKQNGATIYAQIDQQEEMRKNEIAAQPLLCIIFGNPLKGAVVMQENTIAALDLPLKLIAWQDAQQCCYIAYNDFAYLANRFSLSESSSQQIDIGPLITKVFSLHFIQRDAYNEIVADAADEVKLHIANTFLAAMKINDWELMRSLMLPNVTWTLPGKSLLSGLAVGVDAVVQRVQSLKKFGVTFHLLHILYGRDGVALSLHNTAKRNELILDEFVTITFQLKGDKVSTLITHLSDVPGIERFFVPGIIE